MGSSLPPPMSTKDDEKRSSERIEVSWAVDCETDDTFLYASIANISEMGIFVRTDAPFAVGTYIRLRFTPENAEPFFLLGRVQWLNEVRAFGDNINPGMGIMFMGLAAEDRERLVALIRTIAYLRSDPCAS
jgi:type IV pilus assembly protein PilZ